MIRYFQVAYGYALFVSCLYLLLKIISIAAPLNSMIILFLILSMLSLIKIRPNKDSPNYPFAFDFRLIFQHQT